MAVQPWYLGLEGERVQELIGSNAPVIAVIAGPGSGKTTGIKRRVQRLVDGDGVDPERIFVGTFTRAIARELQAALGQQLRVSTLHSLALRLLRENPAARGGRELRFLLRFEEDAMLYDIGEEMPEAGDQGDRALKAYAGVIASARHWSRGTRATTRKPSFPCGSITAASPSARYDPPTMARNGLPWLTITRLVPRATGDARRSRRPA